MADPTPGGRPRAPTITVDTSNLQDEPQEPTTTYTSPITAPQSQSLAVPSGRERGDSIDSTSTTGSTAVGSPTSKVGQVINVDKADVWKPEDEAEAGLFHDEDSPFGLTRGHLSKLIPRKDMVAFYQMKGPAGLERALRTNLKTGLPADEETISGRVSFEEVQSVNPNELDTKDMATATVNEADEVVKESKSSSFADRKRVFGDNRLPERKAKNFFQLAWEALQDKILILLCIAAVISLALGIYQSTRPHDADEGANIEWVEGVAILVAVFIVVFVGALNDWQKERQFKKLNEKKEDRTVKVIRSGTTQKVSVWDVFPGDVMILDQGDVIPVDGIFIDGHNVSCDESSATGESDLLKKTPGHLVWKALHDGQEIKKMDPFIISGAKVSEGVGTFLVTAVGVNSSHGKLMMALSEDNEATPLQFKLNRLASYIAKLGSSAGLLLFIVLFGEYASRLGAPADNGEPKTADDKAQGFINILITAVTIIVVAVPEGLPLAVTLALAFATKRMTKDNNLVRHLQSCETMGNATVICSDKTGTLTQNVMTVVAVTFGRGNVRCGDKDRLPVGDGEKVDGTSGDESPVVNEKSSGTVEIPIFELNKRMDREVQLILKESIAINSTAFEGEENGKKAFIGSKTETALLDFAERCFGLGALQAEREALEIVQLIPFDSGKKCMGVVIKQDGKYRLFIKGASEIVLKQCSQVLDDPLSSLATSELTATDKSALNSIIYTYASMSLRTIGMAYRDFSQWPPQGARTSEENPQDAVFDDINKDLIWLGVTGIQDPVRNGVPEAVKTCERAGVRVIMVTGDNVETARAIAKDTGILKEGGEVIQGPEFRKLSQVALQELLPKLCVIARSSPEDKKFLVNSFRAEGHVVAVTGDGTNDAPALKAADVGFSMGITGTEVAKEASDIILMDDNFSSIVKALAWGRTINDAVKKFLQFQLTVNIVAVIVTFVTAVASSDETSVLNAVQLLWINLIMDTFAALALATDPPAGSLLDRKPEPRGSALISVTMWKTILGQSTYQLIVIMVMYFVGRNNPDFIPRDSPRQFSTLVFNTFTWMQIFDAVNCRRIDNKLNIFEGFFKNRFFMGIILIMIGGQVLIVSVGGAAFAVTQNTGAQWGIAIVIGFITLPIGVLIRCIPDSWALAAVRPLLKALSAIVPKPVKNWWARRKARKAAKAIATEAPKGKEDDPEFSGQWNRVSQQVYDDLSLYKRLRGPRRLKNIKTKMRNPKTVFSRSRSGSRSVLPALVAPGAMAGSVGGGVSPSNRSINTLPKSVEEV